MSASTARYSGSASARTVKSGGALSTGGTGEIVVVLIPCRASNFVGRSSSAVAARFAQDACSCGAVVVIERTGSAGGLYDVPARTVGSCFTICTGSARVGIGVPRSYCTWLLRRCAAGTEGAIGACQASSCRICVMVPAALSASSKRCRTSSAEGARGTCLTRSVR